MAKQENDPIILDLDEEFEEEWAIVSAFTLEVPEEQIDDLLERSVDTDGRSGMDVFGSKGKAAIAMLTNEGVRGTQRAALELMAVRYKAILGSYATAASVVRSSMSLQTIVDMVVEPGTIEPNENDDGADYVAERFRQVANAPLPPSLDVTPHLQRILSEYE